MLQFGHLGTPRQLRVPGALVSGMIRRLQWCSFVKRGVSFLALGNRAKLFVRKAMQVMRNMI